MFWLWTSFYVFNVIHALIKAIVCLKFEDKIPYNVAPYVAAHVTPKSRNQTIILILHFICFNSVNFIAFFNLLDMVHSFLFGNSTVISCVIVFPISNCLFFTDIPMSVMIVTTIGLSIVILKYFDLNNQVECDKILVITNGGLVASILLFVCFLETNQKLYNEVETINVPGQNNNFIFLFCVVFV